MMRMLLISVRFGMQLPNSSQVSGSSGHKRPASTSCRIALLVQLLLLLGRATLGRLPLLGALDALQALDHEIDEMLEHGLHVMRPWARFGMPLETEGRLVAAFQSLQRAVKERPIGG